MPDKKPFDLGGAIATGLKKANPYIEAALAAKDIFSGIKNTFFNPDRNKIDATGVQQNIERAALAIQDQVNSGTMDVNAALRALDSLEAQARAMGSMVGADKLGGNAFQSGSVTANIIIGNVRANLMNKRVGDMNAPLGDRGLAGTEGAQSSQLRTLLRNRLAGTERGEQLAGTPIDKLTQPTTRPTARLDAVSSSADSLLAPKDDFQTKLRDALRSYATKEVRY